TLEQLAGDGRLPGGLIEDWPDIATRGVMLDISRDKVPTLDTVKALIGRLASWKINQVQLYTEHTFAYRDHEVVWRDASPFTAAEIRDLDGFCRARHVELVPNQNCLGHWDRWLAHDRYRPLALRPDGWDERGRHRAPTTIDPTNPKTLPLVRELLAELLPNFTSARVHVGLDEPWELPKERIDDYLAWVAALRSSPELDGREMLIWGDILEGRHLDRLPDGVTVCEWWYEAEWGWATRGSAHERAGHEWWACPGTSSWQTILGRWDNAVGNIANAVDGALDHGGSGVLVTDWGDRGHLQYAPISDPGFAWSAAQMWCRDANRDLDLAAALDVHCYGDAAGVLGGVLHDLGNAHLAIGPQFPNMSTLVLHLYFPQMQTGRSFTEGITPEQVATAEAILGDCDARLGASRSSRADAALVVDELRSAIALVRLLCRDLQARLEQDGWLTSVPERTRRGLADDLAPLIAHHRELWLARNRPGGLPQSAAWLEHLERCYRTGTTEKYWGGW
ncbi:MAG: family 20 glycosylhydrolase, partial [Acidimicrobiales bacterium]